MRLVLLSILACLLWPRLALAEAPGCPSGTQAWVDRCDATTPSTVRLARCPGGRVVVAVGQDPTSFLEVEISRASPAAFRNVRGIGLSPVGEFPDWSSEPKARQDALDAVTACVERDDRVARETALAERRGEPSGGVPVPWLLLGALFVLGVWGLRRARRDGRRQRERGRIRLRDVWRGRGFGAWLAAIAVVVVVLGFRRLVWPVLFFHQNGQGPFWIRLARQSPDQSSYGPGYAEVFGWAARWGDPPDTAVIWAMSAGSALVPWAGFRLARAAGAAPCAAWATALVLAVHPLAIRLAHSESYLALHLVLLFGAAALLASAGRRVRARDFVLPVVAAGLLLSQALRVHPTSWVPAATVPLVLLLRAGSLRSRLIATAAGFGIVGAVVAATSSRSILEVLAGSLGNRWQPSLLIGVSALPPWLVAALVLGGGLAILARSRANAAVALAMLGGTTLVALLADLLGLNHGWVADAYRMQFLPVLLPAILVLFREAAGRWPARRPWIEAVSICAIAGSVVMLRFETHTTVPTDARELQWAMRWRERLPDQARVHYLARAERRTFHLPLYGSKNALDRGHDVKNLSTARPLPGELYYRSSLCVTPEGRPACRAFEARFEVEPVELRVLESQSSLPWLPLPDEPVEVGLFRIGKAR